MAFTFGATQPATTVTPLFGAAAPAATTSLFGAPAASTSSAPLFGSTTTSTAPLFGASNSISTTPSLFGAPSSSAAAPTAGTGLFGTAAPTTAPAAGTGLFGAAPTTAPAAGTGLFGTAAPAPAAAAPLFGAPATSTAGGGLFGATAATSAAPSLFGATSTAAAPKSLFGSPATATPGTSLFGAPSTAAPTASTGLGGAATTSTIGGIAGISGGLGAGGSDAKQETQLENVKEGKVEQPQLDLLNAIKAELAKNKKHADEFACASSDACLKIEDRVRQLQRRISSISVTSSSIAAKEEKLRARTIRDLRLGQVTTSIQENMEKNVYTMNNQGRQYIIQLIREYNDQLAQYAQTIEEIERRVKQMKEGTAAVSEKDITDHLARFDLIFSHVAQQIVAVNDKIGELKEIFNEEHPGVLARETAYSSIHPSSSSAAAHAAAAAEAANARRISGEPALPSQATALQIGQYFRQTGAAAPAVGTTGLFGSTAPAGGGLFGSSTAAKPFSFANPTATTTGSTGSLFGTPTTTASTTTSLFGSTATPAAPSTLSFGKPTIANSSSGLLFSSTPTKLFGK